MAREVINVGAAPNDGTGDPIRTAYIKCNDNFGELYARAQTNPPATLIGALGDEAGFYAYDATYFYYCYQDYDGSSVIWAQITNDAIATASQIINGTTDIDIPVANGNILMSVANVANVVIVTSSGALVNGDLTVTGNATLSGNILGDRIQNGTTSIDIPSSGSNANISVAGVSNIAVFSSTGLFVNGTNSASGNVTGGNLITNGLATVIGNVTGGNFITPGQLIATGNVTGNSVTATTFGKITGDFSSSLANGRTIIQTSDTSVASPTYVSLLPGDLNTISPAVSLGVFSSANISNTTGVAMQALSSESRLAALVFGSGSYQPITVYNNNLECIRVEVSGNIGIANAAPVDRLSVGGNAYFSNNTTVNQTLSANVVLATSYIKITPTDYANLPAAATAGAGARAFITDANGITFAANVAGGGSNSVPVFSDGTAWKIG